LTSIMIVLPRLRPRRSISVMVLTTLCASTALGQARPLQSVVQGDLAPGAPQVYTVRAGAGELIVGTFELRGSEPSLPVTVGLYDDSGRMVNAAAFWGSPLRIGFVTLTSGTYQIRIAAENTAGGTYTLRTERQTPAERMAGAAAVTPIVRFKSTRIDQLAKDVSTGQAGAVDRFWSEAEARGGPLVETIDGNDQYVLLTFLWKEMYETHNVLAIWPGPTSEDYHMSRVPGTNVWYKSVRVFHASRFSYQLAPNDRGDYLTAQRDPLNPLVGGDGESSVLEMPGAQASGAAQQIQYFFLSGEKFHLSARPGRSA